MPGIFFLGIECYSSQGVSHCQVEVRLVTHTGHILYDCCIAVAKGADGIVKLQHVMLPGLGIAHTKNHDNHQYTDTYHTHRRLH